MKKIQKFFQIVVGGLVYTAVQLICSCYEIDERDNERNRKSDGKTDQKIWEAQIVGRMSTVLERVIKNSRMEGVFCVTSFHNKGFRFISVFKLDDYGPVIYGQKSGQEALRLVIKWPEIFSVAEIDNFGREIVPRTYCMTEKALTEKARSMLKEILYKHWVENRCLI